MSDIFKNMSAAQQKETGYLLGVGVENFFGMSMPGLARMTLARAKLQRPISYFLS